MKQPRMNQLFRALAIVSAAVLILGACGGNGDDTADDEAPPADEQVDDELPGQDDTPADAEDPADGDQAGDSDGAAVQTGETDLGTVLVAGDGMTLYIFTQDEEGASTCTGGCADTWPPVTVGEDFAVGAGLDASIFSTVERDDGSTQLAVNGMPLYRYAADSEAGDATGQGVGDVWFVVSPEGEVVQDASADTGGGGGMNY